MLTQSADNPARALSIGDLNRRLYKKLDHNHDGLVSKDEFLKSHVMRFVGVAQTADDEKKAFDLADTNHDGQLTRAESYSFFGDIMARSAKVEAMIALLVADVPSDDDDDQGDPAFTRRKAKKAELEKAAREKAAAHKAAKANAARTGGVAAVAAGETETGAVAGAREADADADRAQKATALAISRAWGVKASGEVAAQVDVTA